MLSKRATLVALTVLAALSVEIGCGDGTHKQPARLNKTLKQDAKPLAKAPAKGAVGPDGKPVPTSLDPKADANADQIEKAEAQLDSGAPATREDLIAADYALTSVSTYINYKSGLDTGLVLQQSNYDKSSVRLVDSGNKSSSGTIANFSEVTAANNAPGREFQVPVSFSINTQGSWDNNIESVGSSNIGLKDVVSSNGGKLSAVDTPQNPQIGMKASILRVLSEGKFNSQGNNYELTTDDGVTMSVKLEKTDANTLTVLASFAEKRMANEDATHTQSVSYDRSFFLRYSITPKKNAGPTSPSNITIVNSGAQQQNPGQQQMDPNTVNNQAAPTANPPPAQLSNDGTAAPVGGSAAGDQSTALPATN